MKVEITKQGVYDKAGKAIPVGAEIEVKGDVVPGWLVNKGRVIADKKGKTAVTNPATGAFGPSAAERQARMEQLVEGLAETDFIKSGAPDVDALNAQLGDTEAKFTAEERDQLWAGIATSKKAS